MIPLNQWLTKNKSTVNHSKTVFILFTHRKDFTVRLIQFGNNFINQASATKFLGLTIDQHLKFCDHVNNICSKISKSVGIIYKLNKFFPKDILKTIYQSLIVPYLSYCQEIYYSAPQYCTNRVSILQKKAVRAMNSLPFNDHTQVYFKTMQLLKLEDMYTLSLVRIMHRKIHHDSGNLPATPSHNYETRNRTRLSIPLFNRTATQKTFNYQLIVKWNSLPEHFKSVKSKNKFKITVKNYLLSLY